MDERTTEYGKRAIAIFHLLRERTVEVANGEIIVKYPDGAVNTISVK